MAHIQFEILLNLQVPKMDSVRTGTYTILHYSGGHYNVATYIYL